MITEVIYYRTEDGKTFPTYAEATQYELEFFECEQIEKLLGKCVNLKDGEYFQHDVRKYREFKIRVMQVLKRMAPTVIKWPDDLLTVSPHSYLCRYVDDAGLGFRPIGKLFHRLGFFEEKNGREHQQPYYATNPGGTRPWKAKEENANANSR